MSKDILLLINKIKKDKKLSSLEYSSNLIMNRLKYQISKLL